VTDVVVGLDIGGTKTAIAAETVDGDPVTRAEVPSADWSASPPDAAAVWIAARVRAELSPPEHRVVALAAGAQGCDTDEHGRHIAHALAALGYRATVVNDAALLVAGAGLERGIGVIAGTGAIAVGQDRAGAYLFAGGWGWVLSDDASAPGIVREATRAALVAFDAGQPDDGLRAALQQAFGVDRPDLLARAVNDLPTPAHWGPKAPAVFDAADRGSALATAVIAAAAGHLVTQVGHLLRRGAVGREVVAAGGVIVHQPRLFAEFRQQLAQAQPGLTTQLLVDPPVNGAVRLAHRLHTR
jgi:N-acetylglucosamine kinase-like BadF-type ATPase